MTHHLILAQVGILHLVYLHNVVAVGPVVRRLRYPPQQGAGEENQVVKIQSLATLQLGLIQFGPPLFLGIKRRKQATEAKVNSEIIGAGLGLGFANRRFHLLHPIL